MGGGGACLVPSLQLLPKNTYVWYAEGMQRILLECYVCYCLQQSCGKVMFSQARVKNSVHRGDVGGGGSICGWGVHGWGMHDRMWGGAFMAGGHVWWGVCVPGGMHGRGVCMT